MTIPTEEKPDKARPLSGLPPQMSTGLVGVCWVGDMMYETLAKALAKIPPPKSEEAAHAVGQMMAEFFSGSERAKEIWIAWCHRGDWKPWLDNLGKAKGNTEQTKPN